MGVTFEFTKGETKKAEPKSEKLSLTDLRKQLRDLLKARESGYAIPQPVIDLIEEQIRIRLNVHAVYRCSNKKCQKLYESYVPVKEIGCGCGYRYLRIWSNSKWQR